MRASMARDHPSMEISIDGTCSIDRGMASTSRGAAPSSSSSSSSVVVGRRRGRRWRLASMRRVRARRARRRGVGVGGGVRCGGGRSNVFIVVVFIGVGGVALYVARCGNTMRLNAIAVVVVVLLLLLGRDRLAIHARFHARIVVERRGVRRHRARMQRRRGGSIGGGRPLAHGGPVGFDVRHRGVDASRERGEREERECEGGAGRH